MFVLQPLLITPHACGYSSTPTRDTSTYCFMEISRPLMYLTVARASGLLGGRGRAAHIMEDIPTGDITYPLIRDDATGAGRPECMDSGWRSLRVRSTADLVARYTNVKLLVYRCSWHYAHSIRILDN